MKRASLLIAVFFFAVGLAQSQTMPYRVVFDLTSRDSLDQKAVTRWIKEITTSNPQAQLEIVMYGKGYELVMPEKSTQLESVREALQNPNVSFRVCRAAMRNNMIEESQLAKGVQTVPDGIYEVISKQHEGWGYIKVAH